MRKIILILAAASTLLLGSIPTAFADSPEKSVPQGVGSTILQNSDYFGGVPADTPETVDIVMKIQDQGKLAQYIKYITTPGSENFREYLGVDQFKKLFAPEPFKLKAVTEYLAHFGIKTSVHANNLVITANGTAGQFNQAFNVVIQYANYKGKDYHGTKTEPKVPSLVADNILCILGLSNYSNLSSRAVKQPAALDESTPTGPLALSPSDLISKYNVKPLYDKGATGAGQTIGIVTLADFNVDDAYAFWNDQHITVKPNRITKVNVDGGSGWNGYDETTLDVEQSGALAPQADIRVYVGPNSDTGFLDTFSTAISENIAQQVSVSWGESEPAINLFVQLQLETPEYAQAFNQLFMEAAAQGISMFAASGDEGAYDAVREFGLGSGIPGVASLSVDNPADSAYITAAGGTTLPFHFHSNKYNYDVHNDQERAWGWDYLYGYFDVRGLNNPIGWGDRYLVGGGGGFSKMFATPWYQQGVSGVNTYTSTKQWTTNSDGSSLTRDASPTILTGTGTGRNMPDISMNADPYTGYKVLFSNPGTPGTNLGYAVYGGTSFVSPQLNGLSALINGLGNTRVGFWNPQIYSFAQGPNSPLHPLNTTGTSNDNGFYTGTAGTIYNQATGLGTPDVEALANAFLNIKKDNK
ncbi:protease pro-enzyme activation domain-containing protein [Paenibacillus sp. GP183]|uniref:S53 family peptidase n=1 Tax=Paenibacillus sp. GP183 TaxID=1882751 RepID=UPI00089782E7|nr:protease pro-enzyme activation domain-containing protein [Paenibacillus sp. GP183]SED14001.1 Pro-kumamolisin, activation domain [Paenibacillus sp. GP183]